MDAVAIDLVLDQLDLDRLLDGAPRGGANGADIPLTVDDAPDVLVEAKLAARALGYAGIRLSNVALQASVRPGLLAVDDLRLEYLGAQIAAAVRVTALSGNRGENGGQVSSQIEFRNMDVQALRTALGLRPIPLLGRAAGRLALTAAGMTLNRAVRGARISAAVTMERGSVARQIIELASLDARNLLRAARGTTPVSCAVLVADMRAGVGTVSPLRIRSASGTVVGAGRFDLYRRSLDLVIGSEARTTSSFALDVPVRVFGSFADPSIRPAAWSSAGRALIGGADDLTRLLPAVQGAAAGSRCFQGRQGRPR